MNKRKQIIFCYLCAGISIVLYLIFFNPWFIFQTFMFLLIAEIWYKNL